MRAKEFLRLLSEDNQIGQDPLLNLKNIISSKIKELPPTKETQSLLSEIEDLLQNIGAGNKLGIINQELAKIEDPSVKKAQKLLSKYILSIQMTPAERADLFKMWRGDQLINRKILLSPGRHKITDVVNGYNKPYIKELVDDLSQVAALGQGKGEFLLSVLSKGIFKMQKGDLQIDGRQIEVKTLDVGGGRFFDQEVRPAAGFSNAVENFKNTYREEIAYAFPSLAKTGLKLVDIIDLENHIDPSAKAGYWKNVTDVLENIFPGMDVSDIVKAMQVDNIGAAKQAYAKTNLDYYRSIKKDDYGILFIDLTNSTLVFFKDTSDLEQGGLRLHAETVYPVTSDPRNAYPQMRIISSKAVVNPSDASTAKKPAPSKPKVQPPQTPATPPVAPAPQPTPTPTSTLAPGVQNQQKPLAASSVPMGQ